MCKCYGPADPRHPALSLAEERLAVLRKGVVALYKASTPPKPTPFEAFVASFPAYTALDVFCNLCGRPMSLTFSEEPVTAVVTLSCHGRSIGWRLLTDHPVPGNIVPRLAEAFWSKNA